VTLGGRGATDGMQDKRKQTGEEGVSEESMDNGSNGTAEARTRRTVMLVVVGVALLAGALWGVGRWSYARAHVSTDNAQVDGHIVPILAKVGGYVRDVDVEDNQSVHGGDIVVVIDDSELRVKLAEAQADLEGARAAAGTTRPSPRATWRRSTARSGRHGKLPDPTALSRST